MDKFINLLACNFWRERVLVFPREWCRSRLASSRNDFPLCNCKRSLSISGCKLLHYSQHINCCVYCVEWAEWVRCNDGISSEWTLFVLAKGVQPVLPKRVRTQEALLRNPRAIRQWLTRGCRRWEPRSWWEMLRAGHHSLQNMLSQLSVHSYLFWINYIPFETTMKN